MKLLVLTEQWFPDYAGGTARVATDTARLFADRGHAVDVIAPCVSGHETVSRSGSLTLYRAVPRGLLPQSYTDPLWLRRNFRSLVAQRRPDVVVAHSASAVWAMRGSGIPCAYVFHASPFREARFRRARGVTPFESARSIAVEPGLWWRERIAAGEADRILVLSEFSRGLLAEDYSGAVRDKTVVVGGGVDLERYRPAGDRDDLRRRLGIAQDESIILTVRRLVNRMGVDVLIDAFRDLAQRTTRRMRLVIIGSGEMRPELERRASDMGDAVSFLGRVDDEAVLEWYQAADVFALPTVAYEGFGMVTAEALACGTPVVGTRVGATAEILASLDDGLLASAPEPTSFAEALERTLQQQVPTRDACRQYCEQRFSWATVIRRWEEEIGAAAYAMTS